MAKVVFSERVVDLPAGSTIQEAVSAAGGHPDAFIFLIGGRPVPMDTVPPEDAEVRAMRVASGG